MKMYGVFLIALAFLPALGRAQSLPDAPPPNPIPDAAWQTIENLATGQEISARVRNAFPLDCRFAGATDAELFCDRLDAPVGAAGYRVARADVLNVREIRPRRDMHPGLVAAMVISGSIVGLGVARNGTAGQGALFGGTAALLVGGLGYLISEGNRAFPNAGMFSSPQAVGISLRLPVRPHHAFPRALFR